MTFIKSLIIKYSIIMIYFISFFLLFIINYLFSMDQQHFVHLAKSFTQGKLYFNEAPSIANGWDDTTLFKNHYYWPLGIFPAVLLMPFVMIFGIPFLQNYLAFPLTVLSTFFLYKIFKVITGNTNTSLVLSYAYIFSTAYIMVGLFPVSWYFGHVVTSTCLIGSLYLTLVKRNPFLAGMLFSFGFLSRISIFLGITFFVLYHFLFERKVFVKNILRFGVPVVLGILTFFIYNYLRFGNIFETGYANQILFDELAGNRDVGMWSPLHFKNNLYLFLLKGPNVTYIDGASLIKKIWPDKLGMSVIFTSPIVLYLVATDMRKKFNIICVISALTVAIFLFGSFGMGYYQYGYRFALDFQPFLFLILADIFKKKKIGIVMILFVFLSYLFNLCMIRNYDG